MHIQKRDLLTPANAVSSVGLVLTLLGALQLDTLFGVMVVVIGRALDLLDGPIARRTRVSPFGAAIDGVFDKLALAGIVIASAAYGLVFWPLLLWVAAQNLANAFFAAWAVKHGRALSSSWAGKRTMFLQISSIALVLFANFAPRGLRQALIALAIVTAVSSIPLGCKATYDYARKSLRA